MGKAWILAWILALDSSILIDTASASTPTILQQRIKNLRTAEISANRGAFVRGLTAAGGGGRGKRLEEVEAEGCLGCLCLSRSKQSMDKQEKEGLKRRKLAISGLQGGMLAALLLLKGLGAVGGASRGGGGFRSQPQKREAQVQRTLLENAMRARRLLMEDIQEAKERGSGGDAEVERDRLLVTSLSWLVAIGAVQEIFSRVCSTFVRSLTMFRRPRDDEVEEEREVLELLAEDRTRRY